MPVLRLLFVSLLVLQLSLLNNAKHSRPCCVLPMVSARRRWLLRLVPCISIRGESIPRLTSRVLAVKVSVPVVMTFVCSLAKGVGLTFMTTWLTPLGPRLVRLMAAVTPIRSPLMRACELALMTGLRLITLMAELHEALTISARTPRKSSTLSRESSHN